MNSSTKKNFIYSSLYQVLVLVLPLITTPYVSRVFGAENLGVYSYTNTIAQYFVIFAMLGLNNYGNRAVAMTRDDKEELNAVFSEIYTMQLVTGILSLLVYVVYAVFVAQDYKTYSLILTLYVLSAVFDINWLFFGLEKFKLTVTRNSIIKIGSVVAILVLVKTKDDLWIYTSIYAVSMLLSTIALWPYARKEVKYHFPKVQDVLKHIKPNMVMFIPVIAVSIYKYMDKLMLGGFSKTETGYYENVEKIMTVALGFITAFGNVMLPRMSNMVARKDVAGVRQTIATSMRFVLGLSCALTFGMVAVAPEFVGLYFGKGFEPCITVMIALAPTMIFQSWANVIRTQYLIPFKHDNVYVVSVVFGALINFIINYLMIPKYGALGAVAGTIIAEASVAIIQTVAVRKELNVSLYFKQGIPFLLFGFAMYALARCVSGLQLSDFAKVAVEVVSGAVVYLMLWGGYEMIVKKKKLFKVGGGLLKYKVKKNLFPNRITSDEYVKYLNNRGVEIGKGTHFFDPQSTTIDTQRPWMLHIGEYCKITSGVVILCHDYSRSVLRRKYGEVIGEARETIIGDNVFIGIGTTVCMGSTIGDNVIIGAGSVVSGKVPSDSVYAGVPARFVCTLDEYYQKRKAKTVDEAKQYAEKFIEKYGRNPTEKEMGPFWQLFMPRDIRVLREKGIFTHLSGDDEDEVLNEFLESEPEFSSLDDFLSKLDQ